MTDCNREQSDQFLAGVLSPREEMTFVEHIDQCPRCRRWLEESAGSDADWKSVQEVLLCSETLPGLNGLGSQSTTETINPEFQENPEQISRASLAFLAPTDDPAMIGRVGPYEILGTLGRGAMGIVLKGFDRALHRNVAIKVLDPSYANHPVARQRFAREAQAMAAVSHEHVVPVYGVAEHAGIPYFVMEYIAGGSLERRIQTQGQFDVVSIVRIALQTARGLAAAHAQGIVHRDIKPGNILIDAGTDRIRVADFGLVRIANDVSCTRSGMLGGTPQYMAPEQVRGEVCDAESDLFSLGVVMYVLCTGHTPFRSESIYGVMQRIIHDAPRSIREQNPAIPDWLEGFIYRLLAKDRRARFASANETVGYLERELAHLQSPAFISEPVRPWVSGKPPTGSLKRLRRPAALMTAILTIAAIIVFQMQNPARDVNSNSGLQSQAGKLNSAGEHNESSQPIAIVRTESDPWDAKALENAQGLAATLEVIWHAPAAQAVDLWEVERAALIRRIKSLTREMSGSEWNPGQPREAVLTTGDVP